MLSPDGGWAAPSVTISASSWPSGQPRNTSPPEKDAAEDAAEDNEADGTGVGAQGEQNGASSSETTALVPAADTSAATSADGTAPLPCGSSTASNGGKPEDSSTLPGKRDGGDGCEDAKGAASPTLDSTTDDDMRSTPPACATDTVDEHNVERPAAATATGGATEGPSVAMAVAVPDAQAEEPAVGQEEGADNADNADNAPSARDQDTERASGHVDHADQDAEPVSDHADHADHADVDADTDGDAGGDADERVSDQGVEAAADLTQAATDPAETMDNDEAMEDSEPTAPSPAVLGSGETELLTEKENPAADAEAATQGAGGVHVVPVVPGVPEDAPLEGVV